jgi:hypothetical protein
VEIVIETVESGVRLTLRSPDGESTLVLSRKKADLAAQVLAAAASGKFKVTIAAEESP